MLCVFVCWKGSLMGRDSKETSVGVEAKGAEPQVAEARGVEAKGAEVRGAEAKDVETLGAETSDAEGRGAVAARRSSQNRIVSPRGGDSPCVRKCGIAALCVVLIASVVSLGGGVGASPVSGQSPSVSSARIWVRKLPSGNVEFGVEVAAIGVSADFHVEISSRYFRHENVSIGTWHSSEPVVLPNGFSSALVAVRVRKLPSGNLEFLLRVYGLEDRDWMPNARYFRHSVAREGSIYYSSRFYLEEHARACLNGAVPNPATNLDLFRDCEVLLASKDTLEGTTNAFNDWSGRVPIHTWGGDEWGKVTVSGNRVTELIHNYGFPHSTYYQQRLQEVPELATVSLPNESPLDSYAKQTQDLDEIISRHLGNIINLDSVRIDDNRLLKGSIPAELGKLSNLEVLDLGGNKLKGSIPAELGKLNNLRVLDLSKNGYIRNGLKGSIPAELGKLNNLRVLDLSWNGLSGRIPSELGNLNNLKVLNLEINNLMGRIPSELGSLNNLEVLDLSSDSLRVGLSASIPAELGNLSNLEVLDLNSNSLSDRIPSELGNLGNLLKLDLSRNYLVGPIPSSFGSLNSLSRLYIGGKSLSGSIPAELGELAVSNGGNIWEIKFYITVDETGTPELHDNPGLTGCIPSVLNHYGIGVTRGNLDFCPYGRPLAG